MARIRTIKPDMGESRDMARMGFGARYFFVLLLCHLDDKGRAEWLPKKLAGAMYAHDCEVGAPELEGWLSECVAATVLVRYRVDGSEYVCAPSFSRHQTINRPVASRNPGPDEADAAHGGLTEDSLRTPVVLMDDSRRAPCPEKEREREVGKGKGKLITTLPVDAPLNPPSATDGFEGFWASYPRKASKQEARKAWAKLTDADRTAAQTGLAPWVASETAGRDRGEWLRFCPHAASWLRARRWEDVPQPTATSLGQTPEEAEAEAELAKVRAARLTPRCPVPRPRPPSPPPPFPPDPEPEDAEGLARKKAKMMDALGLTPSTSTVSEPVQQDQRGGSGAGRDHRDPPAPRGASLGQSVSLSVVDGGGPDGGF